MTDKPNFPGHPVSDLHGERSMSHVDDLLAAEAADLAAEHAGLQNRFAERAVQSAARPGHVAVFLYADSWSKRIIIRAAIAMMIAAKGNARFDECLLASVLAGVARQPGYLAEHDEQRAAVAAIGLAVLQGLGSRVHDGTTLHIELARDCGGWHGTCQIGKHRAASREPEKLLQPSVRPGEVLCTFLAHCHHVVELRAHGEEIHRLGAAWRPEDVPSRFNVYGIGDHDALTQTALAELVLAGQDAAKAQASSSQSHRLVLPTAQTKL